MKTKCLTLKVLKLKVKKMTGLVMALILLGSIANAQTCPLACNDLIQVSVDDNCKAKITPDMLLEAPGLTPPCNYQVVIYDENDQPLPDDTVRCEQVGKTLKAKVTLGANSCWSYIKVEDKTPPLIRCANPDTVMCNATKYAITSDFVYENCCTGYTTVILSDEFIDYPCDSLFSGVRVICRYYVDESGNISDTCCHEIFFERPTLGAIDLPTDVTFDCEFFTDADPSTTGVPTWKGVPLYPDRGFCEINIEFWDDTLHVCPGTFKIIREWFIYDWCLPSNNGNPRTMYQVIKVLDESGPVVYCPTTDVAPDTFPSDIYTCTGTVILPEPHELVPGAPILDSNAIYVIYDCSETVYSVKHLAADSPDNCVPGPGFPNNDHVRYDRKLDRWIATDLPLGCNWFYYTFTDECGNSTECKFDIYIKDKTPPNAICDAHTVVSLGIDGIAKVYAVTFDDKSWDNCQIDDMLVRRMDFGRPCGQNDSTYNEFVEFCCNDIGKTRMVEFVVIDKCGNSNTCMVEVTTQDKIPPIVTCPPNITVSCQMDLTDLSVFGTVVNSKFNIPRNPIILDDPYVQFDGPAFDGEFYDNCIASLDTSSVRSIDCGNGYIDRIFTVTDNSGLATSCTQRITIRDFAPFYMANKDWPRDYFSSTDCTTGPDTDPDVTGKPVINDRGCGHIFVGYDDQIFNKEPDACIKILRKWTVLDWCYYDPNSSNSKGKWEHTQVIKILNSVPPTFTSSCDDREYDLFGKDCTEDLQITATAEDDCTAQDDLRWRWSIDLNEDGSPDIEGVGNDFIRSFEPGTYEIWWKVQDICGNENECHYKFTVVDKKKPSPYCRDAIVTVVMERSLSIDVWAKDLDIASEDNCTAKKDLEFYFLVNRKYVTSRTFDCTHLGLNTVRMYVRDEAGNEDYCEVTIEIQDPNNWCGTNGFVSVGGELKARNGENIENAVVNITNLGSGSVKSSTTNQIGVFTFYNVGKHGTYRISAEKNDDLLNGVSTKDLALIQRYLLGLEMFDSPLQFIAADANNTKEITAADIASIRRVILGKTSEFDNGQKSWRFVNGGATFPDPEYPWPFEETMEYHDINRDQMNSNFDAVKIGDIDGDVVGLTEGNVTRSNEMVTLTADEVEMTEGESLEVSVYLSEASMVNGMQMTLELPQGYTFNGIHDGQMSFCDQCYNIVDNSLTLTWYDINPKFLNAKDAIFTVGIDAGSADHLSNVLEVTSEVTKSMFYTDLVSDAAGIDMSFNGRKENPESVELYQNVPNPFSANTTIGFEIPNAQDVTLTIFDVTGKVHKVLEGHFDRGYHEFIITGEELNVEGVLYYQLTAGAFSSTRKMLMLR